MKDLQRGLEDGEIKFKQEQILFIAKLEEKINNLSFFFTTMLLKIKSILKNTNFESDFLEIIQLLKSKVLSLMNNAQDNTLNDVVRAIIIAVSLIGAAGMVAATGEAATIGSFLGPIGIVLGGLGAASIGTAIKDDQIKSKLNEIINVYKNHVSECEKQPEICAKQINIGILKVLRVIIETGANTLQKTIYVFLPKDQENEFFYDMLKENFLLVQLKWLSNENEIENLKLEENEKISPYVIISSTKFYNSINNMIIYDPMFKGLIIYTMDPEKFKSLDKNPEWPKFVTEDPYSVFEKTKYLIENLEKQVYISNMYSIISKFEGETLKCLSSKNLQIDSFENVPTFSLEKMFHILKTEEFKAFRNEINLELKGDYNSKEENFDDTTYPSSFIHNFSRVFCNDLTKHMELFKNYMPKNFIEYLLIFPVVPQDHLYEIMFSDYIQAQMNDPEKYKNYVRRQSLLDRADYVELLLNLMKILNDDSKNKTWKINRVLRLYTHENFCPKINKYFLFLNHKVLENFKLVLGTFSYAFSYYKNELNVPEKCYRNLGLKEQDFKANYKKGDRLIFASFTSTSKTKKPDLCIFESDDKEMVNIMFIIEIDPNIPDLEKPKYLQPISLHPDEDEFLFKCFSCFEILSIDNINPEKRKNRNSIIDYEIHLKHLLLCEKK